MSVENNPLCGSPSVASALYHASDKHPLAGVNTQEQMKCVNGSEMGGNGGIGNLHLDQPLVDLDESLIIPLTRLKPLLVQRLSQDSPLSDDQVYSILSHCFSSGPRGRIVPGIGLGLERVCFSPMSETDFEKAISINLLRLDAWTRSLLWVYQISGKSPNGDVRPIRRFRLKFFQLGILDLGEKVLKFHLNYLFSRWSNQLDLDRFVERECPPIEQGHKPGYLFGGGYDQYLRRKLFCQSSRFSKSRAVIAGTLLQCKRHWEPISDNLVAESLKKHQDSVGKSRADSPLLKELLYQVERTCNELFPKRRTPIILDADKYVPSISAHCYPNLHKPKDHSGVPDMDFLEEENSPFNIPRTIGGAYWALDEGRGTLGDFSELISILELWSGKLFEVRGYPKEYSLNSHCDIHRLRQALLKIGITCEEEQREQAEYYPREELTFDARVHVVLEPAKARIITAGPPIAYTMLKPLQKVLHRTLRDHPVFQLIGGVTVESALKERFGKRSEVQFTGFSKEVRKRVWNETDAYVSADYSAATDNLNPDLIGRAVEVISRNLGLSTHMSQLFRRSLLSHRIFYDDGTVISQKWGQLMGSPSSFPILCIINAAVCRYAIERSCNQSLRLDCCPLLINGDDALFRLDIGCYQSWWDMVTQCGLTPSLGKNYISEHFALVNSELHIVRGDILSREGHSFEFCPFVNLGIIAGKQKVLSDTRREDTLEIYDPCGVANELVRGHTDKWADRIMSWYLSLNKSKVEEHSYPGQSWFIPRRLGGLGLPCFREKKLTRGQGKLAAYLAVCPAADSNLPPILGSERHEPTYVTALSSAESALQRNFKVIWTDADDPEEGHCKYSIDPTLYSSLSFGVTHPEGMKHRNEIKWDKLWNKGTDNKLEPLQYLECKGYELKKTRLVRPQYQSSQASVDRKLVSSNATVLSQY